MRSPLVINLFAAFAASAALAPAAAQSDKRNDDSDSKQPQPVFADPSSLGVDQIACSDAMGYPSAALEHQASGVTAVEVEVAPDGSLTALAVVRPSGHTRDHRLLDRAAFAHFGACRLPARAGGPVVRTVLFYKWTLE